MDGSRMLEIVQQYCREKRLPQDEIKVVQIPNWKTVYVEQIGENGRAVMMTEYKVDGKICWAGYSERSQTVYISMTS